MSIKKLLTGTGFSARNFAEITKSIIPGPASFKNIQPAIHDRILSDAQNYPAELHYLLKPTFTLMARAIIAKHTNTTFHASDFIDNSFPLTLHDPVIEMRYNNLTRDLNKLMNDQIDILKLIDGFLLLACLIDIKATGHLTKNIQIINKPIPIAFKDDITRLVQSFTSDLLDSEIIKDHHNILIAPAFSSAVKNRIKSMDFDFIFGRNLMLMHVSNSRILESHAIQEILSQYLIILCDRLINSGIHSNEKIQSVFSSNIQYLTIYNMQYGSVDTLNISSLDSTQIRYSISKMMTFLGHNGNDANIKRIDDFL